eukprot:COSAG02_NODE_3591_length_6516_cov_4.904161_4_plen_158_part_00
MCTKRMAADCCTGAQTVALALNLQNETVHVLEYLGTRTNSSLQPRQAAMAGFQPDDKNLAMPLNQALLSAPVPFGIAPHVPIARKADMLAKVSRAVVINSGVPSNTGEDHVSTCYKSELKRFGQMDRWIRKSNVDSHPGHSSPIPALQLYAPTQLGP